MFENLAVDARQSRVDRIAGTNDFKALLLLYDGDDVYRECSVGANEEEAIANALARATRTAVEFEFCNSGHQRHRDGHVRSWSAVGVRVNGAEGVASVDVAENDAAVMLRAFVAAFKEGLADSNRLPSKARDRSEAVA